MATVAAEGSWSFSLNLCGCVQTRKLKCSIKVDFDSKVQAGTNHFRVTSNLLLCDGQCYGNAFGSLCACVLGLAMKTHLEKNIILVA